MVYYGKSDMGMRRNINEDNFSCVPIWGKRGTLLVVCDGMGGHKAGEVASAKAIEAFCDKIVSSPCLSDNPFDRTFEMKKILSLAISDANTRIQRLSTSYEELEGMGTTLVAGIIYDNILYVTNIGDSRLYLISGDIVKQVSHDHSFVQTLIDQRKITKEESKTYPGKNVITKALGIFPQPEADVFKVDLASYGKGYILLCTDGLTNYVGENDMRKIFAKAKTIDPGIDGKQDVVYAVNTLIDMANSEGGADNITVIVARF